MSEKTETLKRYYTISGRIPPKYAEELRKYDISDPNSEKVLEYCVWEDYHKKNSYQNCIVKDSDYYLSVKANYNLNDLKQAIKIFTKEDEE